MTKNKTGIKDTIFIYSSKLVAKIKSLVKPVAKLITNKKIREALIYLYNKSAEHTYKKCILKYYGAMDPSKIDAEKKEIIDYLQSNPATLLSYEFIKKYKNLDIKVFDDEEKKLKYVFLDNKRLYFTKKYNNEQIKGNFWALLAEQDIKSPHRYLADNFDVSENDIVADIGSAEGNFSLSIIDKVKKIYLFESDPEIIQALRVTFEPWKEKVTIVDKYVSDKTDNNFITLDSFFENKEMPTFLKIDVEGAEYAVLQGAKNILSTTKQMKIAIAAYHRYDDWTKLNDELIKYGFKTEYSKGYVLSMWDEVLKEPYLRRGMIRARKETK